MIHFYDVRSLREVIHSYSTIPQRPSRLCTSNPSTLLFVDKLRHPLEVCHLDCRALPPRPAERRVTHTELFSATDMCCVRHGGKELVILVHGGVYAYNMCTDSLEWSVTEKLGQSTGTMYAVGVASDFRGHVYVCDSINKCISFFTATGQHLGVVSNDQVSVNQPWRICWSRGLSSLIVISKSNRNYRLNVLHVWPENLVARDVEQQDAVRQWCGRCHSD